MPVLDASAVIEVLLRTPIGLDILGAPGSAATNRHAPHLLDIEVMHALRRLVQLGEVSPDDARGAVDALAELRIERHAHLLLLPRIWELRASLTAYDAAYVALAEVLGMPLLTRDAKLSRSHGHGAKIELLS
jgi:predicted nucleic acid-binding protein